MDVSSPISAVVPTLDGAGLRVLAGTTTPLTGRQVHTLAETGSVTGVRLVLHRLVTHGLVHVTRAGRADLYVANRAHLAWPAVEILTSLRTALIALIATRCEAMAHPPVHVSLFGSTARGDGGPDSDIDLLVVRPDLPDQGERDRDEEAWSQVRMDVLDATGNPCQTFHVDQAEFEKVLRSGAEIAKSWARDSIHVYGETYARLAAALTDEQDQ
jgi:hypothetical protein